jgi:uncharacterized protein
VKKRHIEPITRRPADNIHSDRLVSKLHALKEILAPLGSALVAYSGGVDSTFLLKVCSDVLNDKVIAVTAHSDVSPPRELEEAKAYARSLGVKHVVVTTDELGDSAFVANPSNRCYHCKSKLFKNLSEIAGSHGIKRVLDGSNADDMSDYRPGTLAAKEFGVLSPLKEAALTKDDIRVLSREMNLPTWDKPASPCLASRIPYGHVITVNKLTRIANAEEFLRSYGIRELRVRDHGDIARIEVPKDRLCLFLDQAIVGDIISKFKSLGYKYVTLDLQGFRTGSMNEVLKELRLREE